MTGRLWGSEATKAKWFEGGFRITGFLPPPPPHYWLSIDEVGWKAKDMWCIRSNAVVVYFPSMPVPTGEFCERFFNDKVAFSKLHISVGAYFHGRASTVQRRLSTQKNRYTRTTLFYGKENSVKRAIQPAGTIENLVTCTYPFITEGLCHHVQSSFSLSLFPRN